MRTTRRRGATRVLTVAAALALPLTLAPPAQADPVPSRSEKKLIDSVTAVGAKRHLAAFQSIANANGGTRASGTPGYDASRDYVAGKLRKAGYTVTVQPFEFPFFEERATASMAQVSPEPKTYAPTPPDGSAIGEFATMSYSAAGDVTATVQGVDLTLPPSPAPSSTSGCEAADFAGFTAGNIALIQRGTCDFVVKATNAEAAGASAVIIFNEGQPGRTETLLGNLGAPDVGIPVVGVGFAVGEELNSPAGTVVHLVTDTVSELRTTSNVLAESRWGDPNRTVMLGSHLDSVSAGPGINDNGSGSSAILTVAEALGRVPTVNKLRFAWWGAEELGLLGAEHYVAALSPQELAKIKLYLNFDMVGSPNYAFKIYDGDDSDATGAPAGPPGSDEIEALFERYFDTLRQPHNGTDFDGRSDYGPFIAAGVPAGGLFTGAEGVKTAEEARLFGGTAGQPYDPCYHQACDTTANISDKALAVNTGAIATAAVVYAYSRNLPGPDTAAAPKAAKTAKAGAVKAVLHDRASR
ncbi:aminopeptidase [Microtetraspora sp. NBRC 13810]|uniref:M28 family metallopeptidase n=1 Tax=Microtetraspora sp. NBRC 13810 TaxID=3030990 RepID=UPI0024A418DC|nr:M28 family metallopeptidase [Microtetraspora sp. NBRC 13810]GLW06431.1 aminopeptidase [Microtetraspora sp. NBRC 13810]